ncbi:coiled-coil domain-containing protein 39 [Neodiprion fabricii]|uniref:coiled-coil domain-containing protein 39 n=1 Tax=Neodiprion fabricii TaxID=2872261 RepID=UPI001ED8D9D0|nr:coiled-coil domain-containing protein 39 [Neodiprion fabricii]
MALIHDVLTELGWGDGFHVPVANEENKRLEEEIDRKTKYKSSLSLELDSVTRRIDTIKKHIGNVTLEHENNQKLLTAHSMQLDSEDHLFRLCNSTNSKMCQEVRQYDKERNDVIQRIQSKKCELSKLTERLEELKKNAKFDKDQLVQWEEALRRGQEDNQLIERYMKTDSQKFKELELRRQKLQTQVECCRQTVVTAVNGVFEMENVMDRTARLYGDALKERQQLISQWTQSVLVLKQRDDEIHKALREIDKLREVAREKMEVLQEAEKFIENQVKNNKLLEEQIRQLEKKLVAIKDERLRLSENFNTYTTELHMYKKMLAHAAQRTQSVRAKRKRAQTEIENRNRKLEEWRKQIQELKETYDEIDHRRTNIAERTKQLENMIEKEEKFQSLINKEINRIQGMNMRSTSQISELEGEIKTLELQIENERKKVEVLEILHVKERRKLKEKIDSAYHRDFEIQKGRMKLGHLSGAEQDGAELEKKEKTIEELGKCLTDKNDLLKLLQSQIKTLEHDMKKLSTHIANDEAQLKLLKNKKQDQVLLMEGGEKHLKVARARNEETQVNENILRLRIYQAERTVSNINNKVYNLEKYKLEIQATMQEREAEIKAQKEALAVRKKTASTETLELRMAIAERKTRIQQLQTRYDKLMSCLGTTADGEPLTTTYIKIKSAQEKYALQEQGDKLDESIRKTECEIQSMENTLRIVNASNDKYKKSLGLVEERGPEQMEQERLGEEMYNEMERFRYRRAQLVQAKADIEVMKGSYKQLLEDIEKANDKETCKKRFLETLKHQISDQLEKQLRADKSLHKVYKDIQNKKLCADDSLILMQEKDIAIRELEEQNGLALQHITELTVRHAEAEPYIKKLLSDKNMVLPCTNYLKPSPTSSRCHSSASSISTKMATRKSENVFSTLCPSTESLGSIVNIQANFEDTSLHGKAKRCTDPSTRPKKPISQCSTQSSSSGKSGLAKKK